jgi:NTP pyrophosphatase (non-canonical NTP hydrolase)
MEKFISPEPPPTPYENELLVIMNEELHEVGQRIAKMQRFGVNEIQPGQPFTNKQRLSAELGDLMGVLRHVLEAGLVEDPTVIEYAQKKEAALAKYMQNPRRL